MTNKRNHYLKAIIFDFDGVIHDTFELAYGINNSLAGGKISREEYRDIFNGNIYEKFNGASKEQERSEINEFFRKQKELFRYLRLEEKIKENLEDLSEKYMLFIVSSNQEDVLNEYFYKNDFTHIFKEVLGMETHKSKVEKFNILFKKYNLTKDECVFVTDTLGDILEGNKVGIRTIAVDFGFHERERLEKGNPYKIVSSFEDVMKTVASMR